MKRLASAKRRTQFVTADTVRDAGAWREVVVEAHPTFALLRAKGLRRSYAVEWSTMYAYAVKLAAVQARAERLAAAKKARRK